MSNFNQGYEIVKIRNGCWELQKDGKKVSQHSLREGAERAWRHATNSFQFICPYCGHDQYLKPSMAMEMGMNSGHGSCLDCKKFLHLELDDIGSHTAKATPWEEYEKKMCGEDDELDSESEMHKRMTKAEDLEGIKPEDIPF